MNNPHFTRIERAPYEIGHLLQKMRADFSRINPLTADDRLIAGAAMRHAANANDTLMNGLEALGHVMFVAGANDQEEVDACHLTKLGCLIAHIAVEAQFLQEIKWSIHDTLAHDEQAAS